MSALLKEGSLPWQILDLVVEQTIIPIYNQEIMDEYEEVLLRNKFGFSKTKVKMTLSLLKDFGREMDPIEIKEIIKDKGDVKFFQIVMSARRYDETYLVTGNVKDFPSNYFIITPSEMIDIIIKKITLAFHL